MLFRMESFFAYFRTSDFTLLLSVGVLIRKNTAQLREVCVSSP